MNKKVTQASSEQPLNDIETASIEQLRQLQLTRMQQTLKHAYDNVPHYKKLFDQQGVKPEDLQQLSDLSKFPFTTKNHLRDNYPYGMFAVPMEDIVRVHASSGTTGSATVVGYNQHDIDIWSQVMNRSIRAAGGTNKDIVQVAYGYGLFTGGLGAHYGAENLGCTVIPMSGGQTAKQVQLLQDFKPDIIMVTPSYMLNIADEIERQNIDPKTLNLRLGIFGAEPWSESMREELEKRLNIDALDIYGLSEVIGPGVAMECIETKDGPTIWEDHFYPEIIDPETGEVLPDGEEGELVFTTLTKQAMPVIRYRTRDLTKLLPGTARVMRRMSKITGRSDDMLIIRGVNLFPSQIEEQILNVNGLAPHYLIIVKRDGNLDQLNIQVESLPDVHKSQYYAMAAELQANIKDLLGVTAQVEVKAPHHIPRSEGKAQRVKDLRQIN